MNVTCPKCGTVYRLPGDDVKSGTKLRCSVCRHIFLLPEWKNKIEPDNGLSLDTGNTLEFRESAEGRALAPGAALPTKGGNLSLEQGETDLEINEKRSPAFSPSEDSFLPENGLGLKLNEAKPAPGKPSEGLQLHGDSPRTTSSNLEMPTVRKPRFQGLVTILLCLAIVGGGWWMWENTPYLDGFKQILSLGSGEENLATEAASPTAELQLKDVREYPVENKKIGKLIVIEGKVHNGAASARSFIRVEAELCDDKDAVLTSQKQLAGISMNSFQLEVLDKEELENALTNRLEIASENMNVQPGGEVPFIVIFTDVPENVSNYKIRIAEAEITDKPGNLTE